MGCSGLQTIEGRCRDRPGAALLGITESSRLPWQRGNPLGIRYSSGSWLYQDFVMVCVYSAAMEDKSRGLIDNLYWRKARKQWQCFKKIAQVRGFVSLCERQEITSVRGKEISRPEVALRCEVCDRLEMKRRGWEGSGPVSLRRSINR
jgi:hypothetical protein